MNNNITTIAVIIGVLALLGGGFYLGGREKVAAPLVNSADDHRSHHPEAGQNASSASLLTLLDKPAPSFSFADRDGKVYSSENLRGKMALLFFNEGLMCYPSCWNQIVALSKDDRFKGGGLLALSVVVDSKEDWDQAINKMPELAKATVVFDTDAAVSRKFGVLSTPSSTHPGSLPGHTYIVIDAEGIVRYVFDDPNMGIRNDQLFTEASKLSTGDSGNAP